MKATMWLFWTQDILKHGNKQLLCDVGRMKGKSDFEWKPEIFQSLNRCSNFIWSSLLASSH